MKRSALPWIVLGCVVVAALLAWWTLSRSFTTDAALPRLEHRNLPAFHALDVGGDARVTLVQSTTPAIDIEAGKNTRVQARVEDGRLVVRTESRRTGFGFLGRRNTPPPRITVTFPTLDRVRLSGSVDVQAQKIEVPALWIGASGGAKLAIDDLRATSLRVDGSGALDARIAGRVERAEVLISGAGQVSAEGLRARDATVRVSGVGNVVVNAEQTLQASISGAGNIEYIGDPHVTEQISGIGRIKRREGGTTGLRAAADARLPSARSRSVQRGRARVLEEQRLPGHRIQIVVDARLHAHVVHLTIA
jgi:hypothetical protein